MMRGTKKTRLRVGKKETRLPFLDARDIALRGLEWRDMTGRCRDWFNDPEVTRYLVRGLYPNTEEAARDFYRRVVRGGGDLVLAVIWKATNEHIGNVGLHKIDWINRKAELGVVIGEKRYWGCGAGRQAVRAITDHGFNKLNLHKISLSVRADHRAAIACYRKAGCRVEARLKDELFRDGRYHDLLVMSVIRREPR